MENDTPTSNVVEFTKRYSDNPPPTKSTPEWEIMWIKDRTKDGEGLVTDVVQGYIGTHMPFFVISKKEVPVTERLDNADILFSIPTERLVRCQRVPLEV